MGAEILVPTLNNFINGEITPEVQDESRASYIKTLSKEDGKIDWSKSAIEIERMIRAYNPWPGTFSSDNGRLIKIISIDNQILESNKHKIGETFIDNGRLAIQCGQDSLVILRLQAAGKKTMESTEFLKGNKLGLLI